jgi:DNA-binding MarR family transcriptional regulator
MQTVAGAEALAADLQRLFVHLKVAAGADPLTALAGLDISMSQGRVLMTLDDFHDGASVGALAERLLLSPAATSRAVEGLHRSGYVTRQEDELDRRQKRVAITAAGRDVAARLTEFRDAHLRALRDFAAGLSEEERANLSAALAPILARIGSTPSAACPPDESSA